MDQKQQLLIPEKIKVGFQNRDGTYTGKLAYVIYFDQKGVLRKEKSWQSWRDHKIADVEFNNEPTEGFVLNKGVGGQRHSYGWNARNEYIRVYDPRDFEFEISVANLLFILREWDCSRGKGLEGKFVYSWDGTELVLLPVASQDYQNSANFTKLQTQGVKSKELIPGASYITKKQQVMIFLGRFDYFFKASAAKKDAGVCKKYVFWKEPLPQGSAEDDDDYEERTKSSFVFLNELKSIATVQSANVVGNYAELVEQFHKSEHGSRVAKLFLQAGKSKKQNYYRDNYWYYEESPGVFVECYGTGKRDERQEGVQVQNKWYLKDGALIQESFHGVMYAKGVNPPPRNRWYYGNREPDRILPWVEPTEDRLWAVLESGTKKKIEYNTFAKDN